MNRIFIALIIVQLTACGVLTSKPDNSMHLQFKEPNRISFQGKGAGAGIALMGTMGPVGIALGVAIDEGIAKDIRKVISREKGDSKAFVVKMISKQMEEQGYSVVQGSQQANIPTIIVKRYGFKIMNGSTDATAAEWDIEVEFEQGKKVTVHYPNDFDKKSIKTDTLAALKKDGQLASELLIESLNRVINSGIFTRKDD